MSDVSCPVPHSKCKASESHQLEGGVDQPDWHELSTFSKRVMHRRYQCDIYCWVALGHVKVTRTRTEAQYFLYCEYRDYCSASQYAVYSFSSLEDALDFQDRFVCQQVLPGISPVQTREHPILAKK